MVVVRLSVRLVIHGAVCGDVAFMVMTMVVGMAMELRGAENQGRINLASGDRQQGCALTQAAFQPLADAGQGLGTDPISSADQDQVGGLQLILEQLLDRVQVIEAGISQALGLHRGSISHHMAGGEGLAIHHRDHGIHPGSGANLRPVEGGHQRLRQGQAAGFNNDAIQPIRLLQQARHRGQELILHRAAEAAIGQFHQPASQFLFRAETTTGNQVAVNAHFTELVDQHSQPLTAVQQQLTQQGGLASTEKTRHHSDGQARSSWGCHLSPPGPTRSRRRHSRSGPPPAAAAPAQSAGHPACETR